VIYFNIFLQISNIKDVAVIRCTKISSVYATEEVAASAKAMTTMEKRFLEMQNRDPLSLGVHILMCLPSTAPREFGKCVLIKFFC
jgi:hypothetical protein